jgi:hypothetical protein
MSFAPTPWRPLARAGWGGKAASHFRGALSLPRPLTGLTECDPQMFGADHWGQIGTLFFRGLLATSDISIVGVVKKSDGTIVASAAVDMFISATDKLYASTLSDASGFFRFNNVIGGPFYIVIYAAGSPDFSGTTVNTLMPT